MLVNGVWSKNFDPVQASDEVGRFERQASTFRNWITVDGKAGPTGKAGFKAEPDRYHLYVALICPWASRTLMARKLKKLENIITVSVVEPFLVEECWQFGDFPGADREPFYGYKYIHELYTHAKSDYTGQVTVPILWDRIQQTIVNNESADILRMLNSGFGDLADSNVDLYPKAHREEIDTINNRLYDGLNNGVYQAGFATSQRAYKEAVENVFESLAYLEQCLEGREYLAGQTISEADIRAFVTLIRFDIVYYILFKTNLHQIRDYPRTFAFMERIYNLPGMAETVNIEHIKTGYYSLKILNPVGLIPEGPNISFIQPLDKIAY